ncbi:MAG TPA: patatin-like phospholipase family protein [Nitrospiraceae bacterium]|nr:patatin-like phospholipase family protein [Nitrospiraceae bacterium]
MWKKLSILCWLILPCALFSPAPAYPGHPHVQEDPHAAPWIGIALSGGGIRAAAFSHGVMLELRKLCLLKSSNASTDMDHDHDTPSTEFSLYYLEETDYSDEDRSNPCGRHGGASFLDNTHFLSGVSGGAITAAYYKTHPDRVTEFGQLLKDARLASELFSGKKKTPIWRPPVMLLASLFDTVFQTFKLPIVPIPEIEVAPFATMWLYDGLFESEQLTQVYNDLFLEDYTFGEIEKQAHRPETLTESLFGNAANTKRNAIGRAHLLIHATDIANGRIFTFDKETFACLGDVEAFRDLDLAAAVAASSSLPGVFSPMRLKSHFKTIEGARIPTNCPLILGDQVRSPLLVDGGVSDNLGVTGLLRTIVERKNGITFPPDERMLATGRGLPMNPDEIVRSSRSTVSQVETTEITTIQRANPKSQKAFLLVVNAGVSSTSSLPKLGGHLDNSFDVLMRDRTDLSRVIAEHLLDNFGFGIVELNMRDLVKNNRVVTRIVKEGLAIQNKTKSTPESIRKVAQAFDFTEMERKVLSDLNNVSLLPTKDEIDTLILAGRAVVAELSDTIKHRYEELADKRFEASCDSIINPQRSYCWPASLETPHVVANKIGVLLDVLTKTGEDFSRTTAENRSAQLAQIKERLWELYKYETRALDLFAQTDNSFAQLKHDIAYDECVRSVFKNPQAASSCEPERFKDPNLAKINPALKTLEEALAKHTLEDNVHKKYLSLLFEQNADFKQKTDLAELKKMEQKLYSWAAKFAAQLSTIANDPEKQGKPPWQESPWYDYLLARLSMLQEKTMEGFHYLYRGATTFPDDANLSFLLGYYAIHVNRDFHGGLKHLFQAREKAEDRKKRIEWLPVTSPQVKEEKNEQTEEQKQKRREPEGEKKDWKIATQERFARAEDYFMLQYAKYVALSPFPVEGRAEFVTGEEVDAWLNRTFPDGHGGNAFSTLALLAEKKRERHRSEVTVAWCSVTPARLDRMSPPMAVRQAIEAFLAHFGQVKCRENDDSPLFSDVLTDEHVRFQDAPCGDAKNHDMLLNGDKNNARAVCQAFAKLRHSVRQLLAPRTALHYARAQARRLYESYPSGLYPEPKDSCEKPRTHDTCSPHYLHQWQRADVYGLTVLIHAIQKACPQRAEDVRTARRLFHVARASVPDDRRLNKNADVINGVKTRIDHLITLTDDLRCGRNGDL